MKINVNSLDAPKATGSAAYAMEIVNQDDPDFGKLQTAIMNDPVLAGTLLKYANSPLMRRASLINNIPDALKLLGINSVRAAVVTATIRSLLPTNSEVGSAILEHMTSISVLCKLIANRACKSVASELEFLGLVHDVGILTIYSNYPDSYSDLYQQALREGAALDNLEYEEYGINHGVVSARTAKIFRLPELHIDLLQSFHNRSALQNIQTEKDRDICVLALAHSIYDEFKSATAINETVHETEQDLVAFLQLSDNELAEIKQDYQSAISAPKAL